MRRVFLLSHPRYAKSAITERQQRLKSVFVNGRVPIGHSHRLRNTFSVVLLEKGRSIGTVSILRGHTSIKTTGKHYVPWAKSQPSAPKEMAWRLVLACASMYRLVNSDVHRLYRHPDNKTI